LKQEKPVSREKAVEVIEEAKREAGIRGGSEIL